jgi:hypothetical protein
VQGAALWLGSGSSFGRVILTEVVVGFRPSLESVAVTVPRNKSRPTSVKYRTAHCRSLDSVVDIETGYGLDGRGFGVLVPVGLKFSVLHVAQTDSGPHPAYSPMGTWNSFPRGKAAEA